MECPSHPQHLQPGCPPCQLLQVSQQGSGAPSFACPGGRMEAQTERTSGLRNLTVPVLSRDRPRQEPQPVLHHSPQIPRAVPSATLGAQALWPRNSFQPEYARREEPDGGQRHPEEPAQSPGDEAPSRLSCPCSCPEHTGQEGTRTHQGHLQTHRAPSTRTRRVLHSPHEPLLEGFLSHSWRCLPNSL